MNLHYNILDKKRLEILPLLGNFKDRFYLAGGTALALFLGYRDSIDFDFFTEEDFSEDLLMLEVEKVFIEHDILFVQKEKNTITAIIDNEIKISFFSYPYTMIDTLEKSEYLNLASIRDIACMKLAAICSRSLLKDYIDLFFIFKLFPLEEILKDCKLKFSHLDEQVILKSLVYFDDLEMEPIIMKEGNAYDLNEIKNSFVNMVKNRVGL